MVIGELKYCIVESRNTCYYSEKQIFAGVTNQDISLYEMCLYEINNVIPTWKITDITNINVQPNRQRTAGKI